MGKSRKQRLRKKFQYNKNRKREWKKSKKLPAIKNSDIQSVWRKDKSVEANLRSMGLVADPNKMFKKQELLDISEVCPIKCGITGKMEVDLKKPMKPVNLHVREALEADAKGPRRKSIALCRPVAEVIGYMLATHGDPTDPDILASASKQKAILLCMAKDRRNIDQLTPKQIKRKILAFKRVPTYVEEYYTNRTK